VLVQTFSPDHFAIAAAVRHDYHAYAAAELPIRSEHGYPPYTGVIRLIVRGEQEKLTEQFAARCVDVLRGAVDAAAMPHARLLGPAPCPIAKLRAKFRFHAILSSPVPDELRRVVRDAILQFDPPEGVQWVVDVDPVDLL
jgi:primosomal protein N' (replication factor Y) (superfamily II helicase)